MPTQQQTVRHVHQVARPEGFPTAEHFAYVERPLPEPGPGAALVENIYLSVDPYMRELMDEEWELHQPLPFGRAIGRVVASRTPGFAVGDLVTHGEGWSTHALLEPGPGRRVINPPEGVPLSAYLSVLGGTGLTAYVGVRTILDLQPGETVYISSAAGAVGGTAGQIARLLGAARVIGSTGSPAKVEHTIRRLGFHAAFDYHDGPVAELLAKAAPEGIDAALEGVGGDHLEAAIGVTREFGRIAWVGAISQYNNPADPPPAPRNLYAVSDRSIHLRGYQVRHHMHLRPEAEEWLIPHIQAGRISTDETVVEGFDQVVDAFLGVLRGENIGKMLVRIAPG
ncbi:MDR family NADP-dependent oxidoreductase [Actinacidiphila oryziradicis]|uniref:NADP-dependent oxidoreductase n=1 Tax=Actinacidiphila oryziradicis TaxID=2571141 RepID=A0A4U0RP46_9ACTN|nr:NADP-dependent oxidoreductase [Actinacidiphila oryziradicis]TJZ97106.1 NADP-dependent oxidoreductase [Actinacidiphila oryziradicis]